MEIETLRTTLTICNYVAAACVLVGAMAGMGKVYCEQKLKSQSDRAPSESNSLVIQNDGTAVLDRDAPIIIETIQPNLALDLQAYLQAGMQISADADNWTVNGVNLLNEFRNAWNSHRIDISKDSGVFDFKISNPEWKLLVPFHGKTSVPLIKLSAIYTLERMYYLGHSGLLPSSGELADYLKGGTKRTFNISDFSKIEQGHFKKYSNFSDIPNQGADVLRVLLTPKLDQSMIGSGKKPATIQKISD